MSSLNNFASLLLNGLWTTIQLTIVASVLACIFALIAGIGRTSQHIWIRFPIILYVEIFRGTSAFVQLFWIFFALPMFGVTLAPFTAAVLVLGLNVGSYGSEVVRGALQAVPRSQIEATIALNLTKWQRFRYVVFPQALAIVIAPATNLLIDLLKITPLTSLVTISDLTFNAMLIRQQTGDTLLSLTTILIAYFILASGIAMGGKILERRLLRGLEQVS
jgi:polar amino acid transport system permease protein